ncbi:MAG: 3-dehydroquinate dehydratase [Bacteroidales bacterium]|nr:3-dehydroquinate dehydratase [Bacteroidales bacterium]
MATRRIAIINGPNLNLLGQREPNLYGHQTMQEALEQLRARFAEVEFVYHQSNVEGELVNAIQQEGFACAGIIINAGGYSHTSVAIHDALKAVPAPAIEVHLTNIFARESYRHQTLLTSACRGIIAGLGLQGYTLAVEALLNI